MNVVFTASEMLQIYEILIKGASVDQNLINKFREPILSILEKEQEKFEQEMYKTWAEQETKKIIDLSRRNADLISGDSKMTKNIKNNNE